MTSSLASRRQSSGYGGRVLGTVDTILPRLAHRKRFGVGKNWEFHRVLAGIVVQHGDRPPPAGGASRSNRDLLRNHDLKAAAASPGDEYSPATVTWLEAIWAP